MRVLVVPLKSCSRQSLFCEPPDLRRSPALRVKKDAMTVNELHTLRVVFLAPFPSAFVFVQCLFPSLFKTRSANKVHTKSRAFCKTLLMRCCFPSGRYRFTYLVRDGTKQICLIVSDRFFGFDFSNRGVQREDFFQVLRLVRNSLAVCDINGCCCNCSEMLRLFSFSLEIW